MKYGEMFLNALSGFYVLRMIWNHGHPREAVALLVVAVVLNLSQVFRGKK